MRARFNQAAKPNKVLYLITCILFFHGFLVSSLAQSNESQTDTGIHIAEANAAETCDSCDFQINNLDKPFRLAGNWLFTRDDNPNNSNIKTDTSHWILAKTPGSWVNLYDDKTNFRIGWYRATFNFDSSLVGQKVTFFIDTYMSKTAIYFDGQEIYHRGENNSYDRFYAAQSIPVVFTIEKESYQVAIRIDSITIMGLYQAPFDIRKYQIDDKYLALKDFWASDFRMIADHY